MIPIHFGLGESPLFGVLHSGAEPRRRQGVLILGPWGWEALRAHRTLRDLANRFSESGFDVFRFDYSGSGDSFGTHTEVSAAAWLADSEMAMDELLALAGVSKISLMGLRLGGLFAAELASRHPARVHRVALWEPALLHSDFLQWMEETSATEARAFPVPSRFRLELEDMRAAHLKDFKGDLLVVSARPLDLKFPQARSVTHIASESSLPPCWRENRDHGAGAVPVDLLREVQEWFDGH